MDGHYKKIVPALIIGFVLLILVMAVLALMQPREIEPQTVTQEPEVVEEASEEEVVSTVQIGTDRVSQGNFQKVEERKIFYSIRGENFSLPLNAEEVVLACTSQELANASELNYDLISKINILDAETIGERIPANEPIVVFADPVDGVLTAYTVAMDASSCAQ